MLRPPAARFSVIVRFAPGHPRGPWFYAVANRHGSSHGGEGATREQAYDCAMATLRGMIALERLRDLARQQ